MPTLLVPPFMQQRNIDINVADAFCFAEVSDMISGKILQEP